MVSRCLTSRVLPHLDGGVAQKIANVESHPVDRQRRSGSPAISVGIPAAGLALGRDEQIVQAELTGFNRVGDGDGVF